MLFPLFLGAIFAKLPAQTTEYYDEPEILYRSGIDLLEKEKYSAARQEFLAVIETTENPYSPIRIESEYYEALCAAELYNKDAAFRFEEFLRKHPVSTYKNDVYYQTGRIYHRNRQYRKGLQSFEKVDVEQLSQTEQQEYYFKMGYCYFKRENWIDAEEAFKKVSGVTKYRSPAAYYLAHIAYAKGDYEKALVQFEQLNNDANFKSVAPYYIVQIYFIQKRYKDVISNAPPLLVNATKKRKTELIKTLGESYFYTKQFKKALPYLQQYHQQARNSISRHDNYLLGYSLYKTGDFEEAATCFQQITGSKDSLAQYGHYYLAACYLQTGKKEFASESFNSAYQLDFDRDIREDALFNHAQLAFELSYDPYSKAVRALRNYLDNYPNSDRNDEAYNFLFKISVATRNFEDARDALEHIQVKGADYKRNFQQITFYRGIELFNQFDYAGASEMFIKSVDYDEEPLITAESLFWLAESYYQQNNLPDAKKYYLEFLSAPKAKKVAVYNMANYNLGYTYFNKQEYNGSIFYFKSFVSGDKQEPVLIADANLRLGDSWFASKGYDNAISFYDKVVKSNVVDVDYALLQKSKCLGVLQRYPEQISTLKTLAEQYPNSAYYAEAKYELANACLVTKDNENALKYFKQIAADHPGSSYALKSRLKTGLIYYNSGLNDLAINTFKAVVTDYPATPESREALRSLMNIYVDLGQADVYFDYTKDLSFATVSANEQDSVSFVSAENQYMAGDFTKALISLQKYVDEYPEGTYLTSAHYYLGECLVKEEKFMDALSSYEYVAAQPTSAFTESALLKAAELSFNKGDYPKSIDYFDRLLQFAENKQHVLEAQYGLMKNYYLLDDYTKAIPHAEKLLEEEKLDEKMRLEAMLIRAKSLYESDEVLLAKSQFRKIAELSQGITGAESQYHVAKITFDLKDYDSAEEEVFSLINGFAPYDYWVASGFILLADIYHEKGNDYQAQQTLQSIIDNYDGDDLKTVAQDKLKKLQENETMLEIVSDTLESNPETIEIDGENIEIEEY